jgi:hypothetical protein
VSSVTDTGVFMGVYFNKASFNIDVLSFYIPALVPNIGSEPCKEPQKPAKLQGFAGFLLSGEMQ